MTDDSHSHAFRRSREDVAAARGVPETPQTRSTSYRLAFADPEFLTREELRPVRLQLELLKPEMAMDELGVQSTVVIMGSARIADPEADRAGPVAGLAGYYAEARELARLVTLRSIETLGREYVVTTGGGPGIMEAGNRGAADAGGLSVGLNIVLPHEQAPNPYVTPDLCFNFHYFAIRKMHFLMRARAVCIFPGGFGTLDEMFEALTLIQTGRMRRVPFLLFGREFWEGLIDWKALARMGLVAEEDLSLFRFVETAEEALPLIVSGDGTGSPRTSIPGR